MKDLLHMNEKGGFGKAGGHVEGLIGGLLLVIVATALAPTIFSNLLSLNGSASVPSFVYTASVAIIGIGLVYMFWKGFSHKA